MTLSLASERYTVQKPLVRYATEVGWEYLPPEEALRLRRGEDSPILWDVFIRKVQQLNPGTVDHIKAEEVGRRLVRVPPDIEGNLQAWEYLRGLKTVFVEAERRERNLRLLDFEDPHRNAFHGPGGDFVEGDGLPYQAPLRMLPQTACQLPGGSHSARTSPPQSPQPWEALPCPAEGLARSLGTSSHEGRRKMKVPAEDETHKEAKLQIESKVWIPTPGRGVAVNGSATHCSSSGLRMVQIYEDVVRYSVGPAFLPLGPGDWTAPCVRYDITV